MFERFSADCESLAHSLPMLAMLVNPLSDAQLRAKPDSREWSVIENVGHLIDTEQLLRYRIVRMCTLDHPVIVPYDQDAAVVRNGYQHAALAPLLQTLQAERTTTLRLLRGLQPSQLARTGWHLEAGLWTVAPVVTYLAKHDYVHQAQIRALLTTV